MTEETILRAERPCPICGKPMDTRYRPFCSKRCADVDLNRWLSGRYAIAAHSDDESSDAADAVFADDEE